MTWERALAQLVGGIPRIERRTAELDLPVAVWRKMLVTAAARAGLDVRTFLVPWCPRSSEEADRQLVVIVLLGRLPTQHATGVPPDPSAERRRLPGWDAEDAQGTSPPEMSPPRPPCPSGAATPPMIARPGPADCCPPHGGDDGAVQDADENRTTRTAVIVTVAAVVVTAPWADRPVREPS